MRAKRSRGGDVDEHEGPRRWERDRGREEPLESRLQSGRRDIGFKRCCLCRQGSRSLGTSADRSRSRHSRCWRRLLRRVREFAGKWRRPRDRPGPSHGRRRLGRRRPWRDPVFAKVRSGRRTPLEAGDFAAQERAFAFRLASAICRHPVVATWVGAGPQCAPANEQSAWQHLLDRLEDSRSCELSQQDLNRPPS